MKYMPLRKLTKDQLVESIELYQKGFSLQKLGELYGVSRQSMHELLKRRIELRSQKRNGKDNNFYRGSSRVVNRSADIYEYALTKGILVKPIKCSRCGCIPSSGKDGRSLIHGHHEDYSKPLDVIWLCQKCHFKLHKEKNGSQS